MEGSDMNENSTPVETTAIEADASVVPKVGMEFESEKEAHVFYDRYAKRLGFATKIKSSYINRNTKEMHHVHFACTKEGFKNTKETALYKREDTRVGCKARMRVKLTNSKKWAVSEVILEHNHLVCPSNIKMCTSKRSLRLNHEQRIRVAKSNRKSRVDANGFEVVTSAEKESRNCFHIGRLKLYEGDLKALNQYFSHMQCKNPGFFYLMNFNGEGNLRNIFWADVGFRTAYGYYDDVICFDTKYLANNYDLPLVLFTGVNHHGQSILLGCGLLVHESTESFIWLLEAWLTYMSGRPPNAIVIGQCKAIHEAVAHVFPNARYRICLWHIMKKCLPEELGELNEYNIIKRVFKRIVYDSSRIDEFETAWQIMIEEYRLSDNEWLHSLYEYRQRWVPVFVKDDFYAGISKSQRGESITAFFDGYMHPHISLKEFIDMYELIMQSKYVKEAQADFDSFHTKPDLKSECCYEGQLSKFYTRDIFKKFQDEVLGMFRCSNLLQVKVDGQFTYTLKERVFSIDGHKLEPKEYEIIFSLTEVEIRCSCRLFEFKGFLCKHALYVLNHNGIDEIPSRYILSRWRKDFKNLNFLDRIFEKMTNKNPALRDDSLYQLAVQVVGEGITSQQKYEVVLKGLEEIFSKVRDGVNCVGSNSQYGVLPVNKSHPGGSGSQLR